MPRHTRGGFEKQMFACIVLCCYFFINLWIAGNVHGFQHLVCMEAQPVQLLDSPDSHGNSAEQAWVSIVTRSRVC